MSTVFNSHDVRLPSIYFSRYILNIRSRSVTKVLSFVGLISSLLLTKTLMINVSFNEILIKCLRQLSVEFLCRLCLCHLNFVKVQNIFFLVITQLLFVFCLSIFIHLKNKRRECFSANDNNKSTSSLLLFNYIASLKKNISFINCLSNKSNLNIGIVIYAIEIYKQILLKVFQDKNSRLIRETTKVSLSLPCIVRKTNLHKTMQGPNEFQFRNEKNKLEVDMEKINDSKKIKVAKNFQELPTIKSNISDYGDSFKYPQIFYSVKSKFYNYSLVLFKDSFSIFTFSLFYSLLIFSIFLFKVHILKLLLKNVKYFFSKIHLSKNLEIFSCLLTREQFPVKLLHKKRLLMTNSTLKVCGTSKNNHSIAFIELVEIDWEDRIVRVLFGSYFLVKKTFLPIFDVHFLLSSLMNYVFFLYRMKNQSTKGTMLFIEHRIDSIFKKFNILFTLEDCDITKTKTYKFKRKFILELKKHSKRYYKWIRFKKSESKIMIQSGGVYKNSNGNHNDCTNFVQRDRIRQQSPSSQENTSEKVDILSNTGAIRKTSRIPRQQNKECIKGPPRSISLPSHFINSTSSDSSSLWERVNERKKKTRRRKQNNSKKSEKNYKRTIKYRDKIHSKIDNIYGKVFPTSLSYPVNEYVNIHSLSQREPDRSNIETNNVRVQNTENRSNKSRNCVDTTFRDVRIQRNVDNIDNNSSVINSYFYDREYFLHESNTMVESNSAVENPIYDYRIYNRNQIGVIDGMRPIIDGFSKKNATREFLRKIDVMLTDIVDKEKQRINAIGPYFVDASLKDEYKDIIMSSGYIKNSKTVLQQNEKMVPNNSKKKYCQNYLYCSKTFPSPEDILEKHKEWFSQLDLNTSVEMTFEITSGIYESTSCHSLERLNELVSYSKEILRETNSDGDYEVRNERINSKKVKKKRRQHNSANNTLFNITKDKSCIHFIKGSSDSIDDTKSNPDFNTTNVDDLDKNKSNIIEKSDLIDKSDIKKSMIKDIMEKITKKQLYSDSEINNLLKSYKTSSDLLNHSEHCEVINSVQEYLGVLPEHTQIVR